MSEPSTAGKLRIALLGPLSVSRADGTPIAIASQPQRRLLSVLALEVGEVVRSASLEERLGLSAGALRTSISRLRHVVGTPSVETSAQGYRLRADVDTVTFERLVTLAPDLDDAAARTVLGDATDLWRGDPFVEFAGELWAVSAARRLCEWHASVVEDLAMLRLDTGDVAAALVAIQALVEREPYRERARALLLRALVEGGRRTEALRAFQTYRALLRDEVGTAPSAALVELDRAIAASIDTSTPIGPRPGHPAWTRVRRGGRRREVANHLRLPVPLSSFVGRHQDVATVVGLLSAHRLVTLTGAGGCGKTRLAIASADPVAEQTGLDTRWVDLGVVSGPAHVIEQVAAAVGLALQPLIDPAQQLIDHLGRERPMLLILDNAEHMLNPVTDLLSAVLLRCPSLRVLVTSREPLGIAGEMVWRVPSLATPPTDVALGVDDLSSYGALQLFVERARAARPGLVIDDRALGHVASICIGLDGLPFALELAAARTRTHPLEVVAAGISDAVRWHTPASSVPIARHATLHASIAWSVDLTDPLSRSVLVRLAVFQGSFTLEAALAVGGESEPPDEVADAVATLVDASLLQFDDGADRFRMLQTVRRFCTLRAGASGELDRARARHAHHLAGYCAEIGAGRRGIERGPFVREMPDLVAAMDWAREHEPGLVFQMCAGLASVRSALGHHSNTAEIWTWLLSLDRGHDTDQAWRSEWATAVAAQMAAATAHRLEVGEVADEVDRLLPVDADRARGWLARGAAMVPAYGGNLEPILAHVADVTARGDDLELSIYGGFAAYMLALMGRFGESDLQVKRLARLTRRHHTSFEVDTVGNGYAAAVIADLCRGELRAAIGRADRQVPDDPTFSMTAAAALAHVALVTGDRHTLERAVAWSRLRTFPLLHFLPTFIELIERRFDGELEHAADLAEQLWDDTEHIPVWRVHPLPILTSTLIEADRADAAVAMTDQAEPLVDGMEPAPLLVAGVLASRGLLAVHLGTVEEAAASLRELLEITSANGFVPMTIDALEQVAAITDDEHVAAGLRFTVDRERQRIGARVPPTREGTVPGRAPAPVLSPALSLGEAVLLAQSWLMHAASRIPVADALL